MKSPSSVSFGLASLVLGCATLVAIAADPPKDNKGYSSSKPTVVDLGSEYPAMAGRQLRPRVLTIEPGGHIGLHSHKDRPSVVYFVQGTDTATREDGTSIEFQAIARLDSPMDVAYYQHGGILQYVLRQLLRGTPVAV